MADIEDLAMLAGKYDASKVAAPKTLQEVVSTGNCMGCGICESIVGSDFIKMEVLPPKRRMRPVFLKEAPAELAAKAFAACPGAQVGGMPGWRPSSGVEAFVGQAKSIQKGFATDPETRFKAAAAGGLTSLATHMIESGQVKFVLHVKACAMYSDVATQGSKLSFSKAEVFEGRGSRYGPVAPLKSLEEALLREEPFALVAKPCDINAVRNYALVDPRVDKLCKCMMTISCGTYADNDCVDRFLASNKIASEEVEEWRWRGHGCPGSCPYTRAKDGREAAMDYVDFWFLNGAEAGPLTYQWRCKMCADFIGYQADVVVMDCWPGGLPEKKKEITEGRKHEWDGWVLIIARTDRGHDVVESTKAAGLLSLAPADAMEVLTTQPHQARRAGSNFIRRAAHAKHGQPLMALDPAAAARVARWALDPSFLGEVLKTGKPAPEAPEAAEELKKLLGDDTWAQALLQLPQEYLAYHLDNFRGAKKRLERGDAIEALQCKF
ncbi:PAP22 [Symbiodinium pilosum]|uniref:PAP22 protein n=1 Tax=Symbiodinium pilosum TaxID=2952 RepID=A0A812UVP9_SYMPI|nr:PAP22 [Symbiodinium pilosum]